MFDLHYGLETLEMDDANLVACFDHYLKLEGQQITRAIAEQRMLQKLTASLIEDIAPLLPTGVRPGESHAVAIRNGFVIVAPSFGVLLYFLKLPAEASESFRISSATTAKPFPASPA